MITIKCPHNCINERKYIFKVILWDFLGLEFTVIYESRSDIAILYENKTLKINDDFFTIADKKWMQLQSLPEQPLAHLDISGLSKTVDLPSTSLPIIYGKPNLEISENHIQLDIDIFGSSFFMLSRYEEAIKTDRDKHDRFPVTASLAYQEDFLARPIINEYLEILWFCLSTLSPKLRRKTRQYKELISCDVDTPYNPNSGFLKKELRQIASDLLKRKSLKLAWKRYRNFAAMRKGDYSLDPFYTFDWMMKSCEENNLKCAFYFLCDKTNLNYDGKYNIDESPITGLLQSISARGHEIGLHGSYNTYQTLSQHKFEFDKLQKITKREGINTINIGGRQHYLRYNIMKTPAILENSGMTYDSSLYYAEKPGFRCGICYEFTMYDLSSRSPLKLIQRPLIFMEASTLSGIYNDYNNTSHLAATLKNTCYKFNGTFTLLWHNSSLTTDVHKQIFIDILTQHPND
ncbi:polysaccharide deacetylase family protein [Lentisphaera profundi]|uniref:Polysaccharide deacetylase family protein n=1 Tax=Lentisphaera profundi TaxID=1658616 RepID=A0ABY7VYA1_9BACT|nr:polysaccharide deacetylase family protein [Lentisphaera profundi]WDE99150.1 polysaccharide deacetylase family protein [Lentisphaera profundi]